MGTPKSTKSTKILGYTVVFERLLNTSWDIASVTYVVIRGGLCCNSSWLDRVGKKLSVNWLSIALLSDS